MAKRIIWSEKARKERLEILNYWAKRNGNKKYSKKLDTKFRTTIKHLSENNYLGKATSEENIRVTVCENYLLFYEINENTVEILTLFDNRRNPENLKVK